MTTPNYLTTHAAAEQLGVSVDTVRTLIRTKKLAAIRRGPSNRSGYLIAASELARYIAELPPAVTDQTGDQP